LERQAEAGVPARHLPSANASAQDVSAYEPPILIDRRWRESFESRAERNGPWDDWTMFRLAVEAETASLVPSFDTMLCLSRLSGFSPMPHQIETARKVLFEMRGRAVLADEVGLGKTIEAGLVLKEYLIRGLVRKALILVPASLVLQWVRELNQKFDIPAVAHKKEYMWTGCDILVASLDTAKRAPHRDIVLGIDYDMLIVDEAHKLKNDRSANYRFVNRIRKKYCLLLTATPVQNDLSELYNLITVVKPGQLGAQDRFRETFMLDRRVPKNEERLRGEIAKVMIRNRRGDGDIEFTRRIVRNVRLELSVDERRLYDGVTDFVRNRYREAKSSGSSGSMLPLLVLQREVCSSRDAVFLTLVRMFAKTPQDSPVRQDILSLVELIRLVQANTKAEKTAELLRECGDKAVVFTEYRATQEYLLQFLKERGIAAVPYRGGMNRGKKDWMTDLFRNRAQVMVATEAGGEGINLQFCNHIINFDLPWNPMRVEQRIGRVHRVGQTRDVYIFNLTTAGTIEEHILTLLHEKINLFERVIGGLDAILERLESKTPWEANLFRLAMEAESDDELRAGLDRLGKAFRDAERLVKSERALSTGGVRLAARSGENQS